MREHQKRLRRFTQMSSAISTGHMFYEGDPTREIIGAFYAVYDSLGFGFLEAVYQRSMAHELGKRGLRVEDEIGIDVWYDRTRVGQFRADLIVERKVIIEIKAAHVLSDADWKQLVNYLHATELEVGLLFNFGPKASFKRLIFSNDRKSDMMRGA
jgi:GxxExxY protein